MATWLRASVRTGVEEKNILFLCFCLFVCLFVCFLSSVKNVISSAPYKSFTVTDDMLYSSELTKGESMA